MVCSSLYLTELSGAMERLATLATTLCRASCTIFARAGSRSLVCANDRSAILRTLLAEGDGRIRERLGLHVRFHPLLVMVPVPLGLWPAKPHKNPSTSGNARAHDVNSFDFSTP